MSFQICSFSCHEPFTLNRQLSQFSVYITRRKSSPDGKLFVGIASSEIVQEELIRKHSRERLPSTSRHIYLSSAIWSAFIFIYIPHDTSHFLFCPSLASSSNSTITGMSYFETMHVLKHVPACTIHFPFEHGPAQTRQ